MREKTRRDEINTGCCWNKFSEIKSLESSASVQRIEGGQGDPGRTRKATGKPEEAVRGVSWSEVATVPQAEVAQGFGPGPLVEL